MLFFAQVLQRLELFAKLEAILPPFSEMLREYNGRYRFFLLHDIVRYSRISLLQRGVEPQ